MTEQKPVQETANPEGSSSGVQLRQQEINQAEWMSANNWGGPTTLAVYFSKKDSRIWVPQQKPGRGWTLNLAHKAGVYWLVWICIGIIVILVSLSVFIGDLFTRFSWAEM